MTSIHRLPLWLVFFFLFLSKQLILEMNRIGMLVDLAHVSEEVMNQVLDMSIAPVIFSHSSAYEVCKHKRNVPDSVLLKVVRILCRRASCASVKRRLVGYSQTTGYSDVTTTVTFSLYTE